MPRAASHDMWGIGCVCVETMTGFAPWAQLSGHVGTPSAWHAAIRAAAARGAHPPAPDSTTWHRGASELWCGVAVQCLAHGPTARAEAHVVRRVAEEFVDQYANSPPREDDRKRAQNPLLTPRPGARAELAHGAPQGADTLSDVAGYHQQGVYYGYYQQASTRTPEVVPVQPVQRLVPQMTEGYYYCADAASGPVLLAQRPVNYQSVEYYTRDADIGV
eukprot:gene13457-16332_t